MKISHGKHPFDYWILEDFFGDRVHDIVHDFKRVCVTRDDWWKYDNPFEKKLTFDKFGELPDSLSEALSIMNSTPVITLLEELSGIEGLLPDPHFRGGGLHRIQPGGKLDIHADFNIHPQLKLKRRLNLLVYLNPRWLRAWNGCLEFWDEHMQAKQTEILPLLNRAVLFDTTGNKFHGHPDPISGPLERWSLAAYYYTANTGNEKPHSTLYKKRPEDATTPEIEALRGARGLGRLSTQ